MIRDDNCQIMKCLTKFEDVKKQNVRYLLSYVPDLGKFHLSQ